MICATETSSLEKSLPSFFCHDFGVMVDLIRSVIMWVYIDSFFLGVLVTCVPNIIILFLLLQPV